MGSHDTSACREDRVIVSRSCSESLPPDPTDFRVPSLHPPNTRCRDVKGLKTVAELCYAMTSAHDVATAVLNEVGIPHCSESRVGESTLPASIEGATATSMEPYTTKIARNLELADGHAFTGFQSSSSNNSQTTVPDPTTPPTSDGFSSQSQPSPSRFPQLSQTAATQLPVSQQDGAALPQASIATNAGQKRTFDGYAKPPGTSSSSSGSPPLDLLSGHSRTISSVSAASSTVSSREVRGFSF